ncbi:MAG: flagellar hook-length control protein FliK [Luminiphilus sp.]|nr:flagellar hook-length control protein FliK [Luminiphilus sp.]
MASEQAQAAETGGKGLPAASVSIAPSEKPAEPQVAASVASIPLAERVSTTSLPEFDLHVVGEPAERLAVMKYAKQAGLSPEVLAQLFPATDEALVDSSVEGRSLADAVATAIAAWLATNQTQSATTAEASSPVMASVGPAQTSSEIDPARLLEVDVESVNQLIAPILAQVTAEGDAEGAVEGAAPSVDLATQITAGLQALISSQPGAGQLTEDSDLPTRIREVVTPAVAQWVASGRVDVMAQSENRNTDGAVKELANRVTQLITASLSDSQRDASAVGANPARTDLTLATEATALQTPGLTAELESVVARWVAQSQVSTGNAVPEQWVHDIAQRVAPEVAQWHADTQSADRSVQQLSAQIAPEFIKAIQAFTENPLRSPAAAVAQQGPASTTAPLAAIPAMLGGASEAEISALRASVVSQPQPITLALAGAQSDAVQPAPQNLASALAQVMAPSTQPVSETPVLPQSATLDRFALRGVNLTTDGNLETAKTDATVAAEVVKSTKADSVMALRDLVSARSLELARLAGNSDRPAVTPATQPTPFAGLVQGDAFDAAAARVAGQGDLAFRQALAGSDRSAFSDAARLNQFTPNQNLAARELAGRQLSEALGQRLAANIAAGHYRLTFNVHPRELGAIDVVMEMRDGRLDAQINTSNAVTRELLGDSLPRLRDALQQSGVNLAQLQVGSDAQQGQSQGREASTNDAGAQTQDEMRLADAGVDTVSEDLELGLDLDSIDFWA